MNKRKQNGLMLFAIASLVSMLIASSAWAGLIWKNDFETGEIKRQASYSGSLPIVDTVRFYSSMRYNGSAYDCTPMGNEPEAGNDSWVVTSPVLSGNYAYRFGLRKECDYRPFNGGIPDGKQKPRTALKMHFDQTLIENDVDYKMGGAWFFPTDYVFEDGNGYPNDNDDGLFQWSKNNNTGPLGVNSATLQVHGDQFQFIMQHPGGADNPTPLTWEFPVQLGVWHQFIFEWKFCRTSDSGCSGYFRIRKDNEDTYWVNENGANTVADEHELKNNLYKYNMQCHSTGPGYNGSYSDARSDYSWCTAQQRTPTNYTGGRREHFIDNWILGDNSASDVSDTDVMPSWTGDNSGPTVGDEDPAIVGFNTGNPITPSTAKMYWTGQNDDFQGAVGANFIDVYGETEAALAINSNSNGGRMTSGPLTALTGGPGTLEILYDSANLVYSTERDSDPINWNKFALQNLTRHTNGSVDADYGFTRGIRIEQDTTTNGRASMKPADAWSVTNGDQVKARLVFDAGNTGGVDIRFQEDSTNDELQFIGDFGLLETGITEHGASINTPVISESTVDGHRFVDITFTADGDEIANGTNAGMLLKVGANGSSAGDYVNLLGAYVWVNQSPLSVTYATLIDKPDLVAPSIFDCEISAASTIRASFSCQTDEPYGTAWGVLVDEDTCPSVPQIKAGQDFEGNTPIYAGTTTVGGVSFGFLAENFNPELNKYGCFYQEDLSGNGTPVVQSENYIEAIAPSGTVKKFVWGSDYDGLGTDNRVVHNGSFLNTSVDLVVQCRGSNSPALYYGDQSKPDALFYDDNVPFSNGAAQITEVDLATIGGGSINQLTVGQYYWLDCWSQKVALINNITKSDPALITATGHGFETGDPVFIQGISGMTELNGKEFTATVLDANNFSINIDSTGFNTYSSGGTASGLYDVRFGDRYKLVEEAIE